MSKKITEEDIEKAVVKLKPVLGIAPGVYLTVFYGFVLTGILFFILLFPGIRKNGTLVYVDSYPPEASVFIDNLYRGSTPVEVFIQAGESEIRIEKKHFKTVIKKEQIRGRVFGSLIFPLKLDLSENMILSDKEQFLKERYKQLSSFALIEDFYDRYQMPPLISKTVTEFLAGTDGTEGNMLYDFLYSMRVNLGSPEMLRDYISAINIVTSKTGSGNSSGSVSDFSTIFDYFSKENNSDALALSIIGAYPPQQQRELINNLNTDLNIDSILKNSYGIDLSNFRAPSFSGRTFMVNNLNFISVSSGTFLAGTKFKEGSNFIPDNDTLNNYPHPETVSEYFILEKEVTRGVYSQFLKENPEWRAANIDKLIGNNLVTSDYLKNQDFLYPDIPVSNVSWYAADAFTDWLVKKLPESMKDYTIRLPSEAEWEAAAWLNENSTVKHITKESGLSSPASVDFQRAGKGGLYDIIGNLWEWTDNWYFPGDTVNGRFGLELTEWEGAEKAVRGGSWGNLKSDLTIPTRGSQDPAWCTPFTGFRVVVVKR